MTTFPPPDATCEHETALARLGDMMIDISQRCYSAFWMSDLSIKLWAFVVHGPGRYGDGEVTAEDIEALRRLSTAAEAWLEWSDADGCPKPIPIPIEVAP